MLEAVCHLVSIGNLAAPPPQQLADTQNNRIVEKFNQQPNQEGITSLQVMVAGHHDM